MNTIVSTSANNVVAARELLLAEIENTPNDGGDYKDRAAALSSAFYELADDLVGDEELGLLKPEQVQALAWIRVMPNGYDCPRA